MPKRPFFQIDAFSQQVFGGNPAGVCLLENWPETGLLQRIAAENNLPETAFLVPKSEDRYELRWFTPTMEIDLCGHATLASAFVIFSYLNRGLQAVEFETHSGVLKVSREGELLSMNFPGRKPEKTDAPDLLAAALGAAPLEVWKSRDLLAVFDDEAQLSALQPDMTLLTQLPGVFAVIVTAPGKECDFVSRFFAPGAGIPEDPVTGSSHCTLIPYWSERLGKRKLHARQLSARGGELFCEDLGERVKIAGNATLYLKGEIEF